jgi:hypothetical protein
MSLERDELGIRMLCAWNNVPREASPPEWSSHLNAATREAWARVAVAAIEYSREIEAAPDSQADDKDEAA